MLPLVKETSRYLLLTFFIRSLLEGGENDEGTDEAQSRSSGMTFLRIFSDGEHREEVNDCDSDSVRDSSSAWSTAEVDVSLSGKELLMHRFLLFLSMEGIRLLCLLWS